MKTCVFAGTFDPITNGHVYVIEKCLEMFDSVVIAIGENKDKSPLFDLDTRVELIKCAFENQPKVQVKTFSGMLVDFMKREKITINVRGVRNEGDYKYETTMAKFNSDMYGEIITVYIPTPCDLEHVSSSAVRNIISLNGEYEKYLPKAVYNKIKTIIKE